ncbi:50S ribosomal protein L23 [Candidatus Saccharibacteria bacterium]|nr:MAG: 50S ribosomal protein L23 [Candidatus Saccharibacteria bacterium]PID99317.1 MAG: 50S ribosomal protein L23 [Candidatus Saccharibacteria bacterium]
MTFIKPRLSEKAFAQSQATSTFALDVPKELNKQEVAVLVAKQFDVEVKSVRIVNRSGKTKRVMNLTGRRSSNRKGTQSSIKKAYVTLKPGSHLPFFAAAEEEIAKEAEAKAKAAKKAEKKSAEKPKAKGLKKLVGKKEEK